MQVQELGFDLFCNRRELLQGRLQVVGDFLGQYVGIGKIIGIFEALVLEPENVEVRLVPLHQFFVFKRPPLTFGLLISVPGGFAAMAVLDGEAGTSGRCEAESIQRPMRLC